MNSRCEAILITLLSISKKYQKKYCVPSQVRIEELVEKYHGFDFSNRTLNRDLAILESEGYIKRVRRIRPDACGKLVFCTTLYKFTGKLFNWLYSLGNTAKKLFAFFRLPKWADHSLPKERKCVVSSSHGSGKVRFVERDGTVKVFDPATGQVQ